MRALALSVLTAAMLVAALACSSSAPASAPTSATAGGGAAPTAAPPSTTPGASTQPSRPGDAPASPSASPTSKADWSKAPGIVDPTNFSWPRRVKTASGDVEIRQKPQRVHTLSLGADEIALALIPPSRVVAVGTFTADPNFSNVADLVKDIPKIKRDAESILAAKPDIVLVSQFTNAALVKQLQDAGVTVALAEPPGGNPAARVLEGYETSILYLGYVLGEEKAAEELVDKTRARLKALADTIPNAAQKPRVLFYLGKKFANGKGTTADGIIQAAGGINVAAEAGINRAQEVGLESIAAMRPDVIVVWAQDLQEQKQTLTAHPALQDVPAVRNGRIYGLPPKHIDTLSHWNQRGIDSLAHILWPDAFAKVNLEPFP